MTMAQNDDFKGYRGESLKVLEQFDAKIWSDVEIKTEKGIFSGIILPRSETADPLHIVLKLHVGYNIGIAAARVRGIRILGRKEAHYRIPEKEFPFDPKKPNVKLLGTGGTIASRLDYRTGAVIPTSAIWRQRSCMECFPRTWARNNGRERPRPLRGKSKRESME
jgi:glutamyl-tRNA(Gln) amidotransferase subunit D